MTQNCLIEQNNQIEEEKYEKNSRFLLAFKSKVEVFSRSGWMIFFAVGLRC